MSSGNPFGLSEISHYGTMQRVGGKAAGFINKKFFHPSSFRNQEKLWKAQTAHAVEMRKQADMEKRRDEERQVEELRKQMYLAGQAKATDILSFTPSSESLSKASGRTAEQLKGIEEMRRRKALLKQEKASQEADADADGGGGSEVVGEAGTEAQGAEEGSCSTGAAASSASASGSSSRAAATGPLVPAAILQALVKSKYTEDKRVRGHESVWGSWFIREEMKWGFSCCKSTDFAQRCPLAPEEDPDAPKAKKQRGEPRGKRRRKGGAGADGGAAGTPAAASASSSALSGGGPAASTATPSTGAADAAEAAEAVAEEPATEAVAACEGGDATAGGSSEGAAPGAAGAAAMG